MSLELFGPEAFRNAEPFPHAIVDDFIPLDLVRKINAEWPGESAWKSYRHKHSDKWACSHPAMFGMDTRLTVDTLNTPWFVDRLAKATGIPGLVGDAMLSGGGLHETLNGGFLDIHADFNIHPATRLYRRLNLLLFLNEDWQDSWGGRLELWDQGKTKGRTVAPLAGRAVVFETTDKSFHGHPQPLDCPAGRSRRSIALYYYSAEPGDVNPHEHSTLYLGEEETWFRSA